MRRILIRLRAPLLALLLSAGLHSLHALLPSRVCAEEAPRYSNSFDFVDALNAGVRIQRSVSRPRDGRRVGIVHVYWTNRTGSSFGSHVELQCIALRPDGVMIDSVVGRLDAKKVGEIEPGYGGRLVLSLDLQGEEMERVSCSVVGAR